MMNLVIFSAPATEPEPSLGPPPPSRLRWYSQEEINYYPKAGGPGPRPIMPRSELNIVLPIKQQQYRWRRYMRLKYVVAVDEDRVIVSVVGRSAQSDWVVEPLSIEPTIEDLQRLYAVRGITEPVGAYTVTLLCRLLRPVWQGKNIWYGSPTPRPETAEGTHFNRYNHVDDDFNNAVAVVISPEGWIGGGPDNLVTPIQFSV